MSCTALSYFDPGASPTTTKSVFFDTEEAAFPPRARIASLAWSRLKSTSEPVTTMLMPSRVRGVDASRSSSIRTPASRHLRTMSRCQSTPNHSTTASAMVGPTPSAAASFSRSASSIACSEPNSVASARAAVGPTCRMESPTITRHSGRSLAAARLSSSRWPLAESTGWSPSPFLGARVNSGARSSLASSRSKTSPSSSMTPASSSAHAASEPRPSMSKAPRPATWKTRSSSWAGHLRWLGQRRSLSPSFCCTSSVPHDGQVVGITHAGVPSGRSGRTGPTISGITSPALRRMTVSPGRTSLRFTSWALCSVARSTVEPATRVGSITPKGVTRPVRPVFTSMASSLALTSSGGYLYAIAQRGARLVEPSRRWRLTSSTLMTTPSISCSTSWRWSP